MVYFLCSFKDFKPIRSLIDYRRKLRVFSRNIFLLTLRRSNKAYSCLNTSVDLELLMSLGYSLVSYIIIIQVFNQRFRILKIAFSYRWRCLKAFNNFFLFFCLNSVFFQLLSRLIPFIFRSINLRLVLFQ
jgi:hypothetical protein